MPATNCAIAGMARSCRTVLMFPKMNMEDQNLQVTLDHAFANLDQVREAHEQRLDAREIGIVTSLSTGIARVVGPARCMLRGSGEVSQRAYR